MLWTAFAATGLRPPLAPLIVAYLVGYLANATPIPAGIGVLDAGLVGALALYGLPLTHAAAAVLVYHAIAFWLPTLGGTVAYARLRPRLGQPAAAAPAVSSHRPNRRVEGPVAEIDRPQDTVELDRQPVHPPTRLISTSSSNTTSADLRMRKAAA